MWQIYYARAKGADAVLLIAGVLPDIDIKYMLKTCRELGLTALIEVFFSPSVEIGGYLDTLTIITVIKGLYRTLLYLQI